MRIDRNDNKQKLPRVGDRLMKPITFTHTLNEDDKLYPCTVIYVNKDHNFFTVEFVDSKLKESYKVPEVDEIGDFKRDYAKAFGKQAKGAYVYESGMLYPSISECARDIGVNKGTISRHIHGHTKHVKGYHIYML